MVMPFDRHLSWAADVIGPGAVVEQVVALQGDRSPWLLSIHQAGRRIRVILRVADGRRVWAPAIATAAAALRVAGAHDLPTARLVAADTDGSITGTASLIETFRPGSSRPPQRVPGALGSAGAALAALHAIPMTASPDLPQRAHHTPPDDHPGDRRWAHRYRHASPSGRSAVVAEFLKQHRWMAPDRALERLRSTPVTPLLLQAQTRIGRHQPPPVDGPVFLHADVWFGNTLWAGDRCLGLIDWKSAGVGHPGVDLGSLRLNAALTYDMSAAEEVTHGWEETIGRKAGAVAYWDAIAALYTPVDIGALPAPAGEKVPEIPAEEVSRRRNAFLIDALTQLG